jgi:precorrin-2 dehydrogenase/sirohydrochlorin ferrochelatase
MANLFPMFVKLDGRKCLVVGAGRVAESKIDSLLLSGAVVQVVAPKSTEAIARWTEEKRITWHARTFKPADLQGVFLVIAATSSKTVNEVVYQYANAQRILCNAVDDSTHCHFYFPAVVRRGDLQIAISTAGLSPALAQRLRIELESQFGPEYKAWLQTLGSSRQVLSAKGMDPERRKLLLHQLAAQENFDKFVEEAHDRGVA